MGIQGFTDTVTVTLFSTLKMTFIISKLNRLPKEERDPLYLKLIPSSLFGRFGIDPKTLTNGYGERVVTGIFPTDENFSCLEIRLRPADRDCVFSCQVSFESFMKSLYLDFVTVNNPFGERFNVDRDEGGGDTLFGTRSRNIPEEIRAMEAGLAPGMVRPGFGLLREFVNCLDDFAFSLGLKTISIGALYYHNAILWERRGFIYFRGGKRMERIHNEFQPGGLLYEKLDDSTRFRRKGMEKTVRGRSWAIHDGILLDALDEEWESPQMYRMVGKDLQVNTFPGQTY
ncbi:MAG: hypothetical protein EHM36_00295 [Deltaproteobacteria bacterium]|nr:MAG: hypothetical protein EHM36_00295 [Deltaproteobacteria bacterium]